MCLDISQYATYVFCQDHKGDDYIDAYKTLIYAEGHLYSPFKQHYEWRSGVNKSDRRWYSFREHFRTLSRGNVQKGIHVYLSKQRATDFFRGEPWRPWGMYVVVKLRARMKHLIGVGHHLAAAAFTQVVLEADEAALVMAEAIKQEVLYKKNVG